MKKYLKFLFKSFVIGVIIYFSVSGYLLYKHYHPTPKDKDNQLVVLQTKVDELTQKQQEEKAKRIKLQALQDPEIITDKLQKVSKLLVYKGVISYNDLLKESTFWGSKSIQLKLKYNYGISYELKNVVVDSFYDDKVVIKLSKNELKLEYVEVDKESKIDSNKEWFSNEYTPQDTEIILEQSQESVRQKIENDRGIYDKAFESLKESIKDIVLKLGYKDVIFDVF
jgi:hypothetical protein